MTREKPTLLKQPVPKKNIYEAYNSSNAKEIGFNLKEVYDVNPKNIVTKEAICEMKKIANKVKNKKNVGGDLVKAPKVKLFK
jgi:hypothetical protein